MTLALMSTAQRHPHPDPLFLRLILFRGEVYRLPQASLGLRILSGKAWVSFDGQDVVLAAGETARLAPGNDFALVSAVGDAPLILEVRGGASLWSQGTDRDRWARQLATVFRVT